MLKWFITRISEPSTWAGIGVLVSGGFQAANGGTHSILNFIPVVIAGLVAIVKGEHVAK